MMYYNLPNLMVEPVILHWSPYISLDVDSLPTIWGLKKPKKPKQPKKEKGSIPGREKKKLPKKKGT